MHKPVVTLFGVAAVTAVVAVAATQSGRAASPSTPLRPSPAHSPAAVLSAPEARAVIEQYCLTCHDEDKKKGELSLETFDPAKAEARADVGEKMIKKLRAGMMPPPGAERPAPATIDALASTLETRLDAAADAKPNPGRRTFQRLNRAEYAQSIRDILGLDVDVTAFLPADTISANFDNIADVQAISATLLEGYLRAAAQVSRLAVGDPEASPGSTIYKIPRMAEQLTHVDGAPFGTRGGISVVHNFPADGEYTFRMMLHSIPTGQLYGSGARGEQVEVSLNGARVALIDINPRMSESDPNGMNLATPVIAVKAGPQRVSAAFIPHSEAPVDDLMAPVEQTLADTQIGSGVSGVTTVPHLREFAVVGPTKVTGVSDTPSRRRIFVCRPLSAEEEIPCATRILTTLATRAYRRPVSKDDIDGLLKFYNNERDNGGFERGVRTALQAMLASPHFIFRLEEVPATARTGQSYRINDLDMASRLSFFLWGSGPDEELLAAASRGALATPAGIEQQARRMLADPRATALSSRFAAQWLRLQDLDKIKPDARLFPAFDTTLAQAMITETEMLFDAIVREDRDVLELLTADYTFVNERLARHYGIPNVSGPSFRRVSLASEPEPTRHPRRRQHPDADLGRGSDVAGAARQVGARGAARHDAASAPGHRARSRGDQGGTRIAAAVGARADGRAPRASRVPVVPQGDRSARPRAGELRRRRAVAHP